MIDSGRNLSVDVLKVAHHGSATSSTEEFIQAVHPKYAFLSCMEGNQYGHPHQEVVNRLKDTVIYRTDLDGTIVMSTDGESLTNFMEYQHP